MNKKIHEYREVDWHSEEVKQTLKDLAAIIEAHFSKFGQFNFEDMAFCLMRHYQLSLIKMWCHEDEAKKLAKLKHQIRQLVETYESVHWFALVQLQLNTTVPLEVTNGAYVPGKSYKFTRDFPSDFPPVVANNSIMALQEHYKALLPAIEKTSLELTEGIQYKKRAHEAWRLVDAAVDFCRSYPGTINVPRALNPTSPFHKFLEDLFHHFEIETTPEGAFRGWYKNVGHKSEN